MTREWPKIPGDTHRIHPQVTGCDGRERGAYSRDRSAMRLSLGAPPAPSSHGFRRASFSLILSRWKAPIDRRSATRVGCPRCSRIAETSRPLPAPFDGAARRMRVSGISARRSVRRTERRPTAGDPAAVRRAGGSLGAKAVLGGYAPSAWSAPSRFDTRAES